MVNKMSGASFLIIKSDKGHGEEAFRVLLSHRRDSTFGFPGGKIDHKETPFEAVLRECEEEINFLPTPQEILNIGELAELDFKGNPIYSFVLTVSLSRLNQIMSNANKLRGSHAMAEACGFTMAAIYDKGLENLVKLPYAGTAKQELKTLLETIGYKHNTLSLGDLFE